MEEWSPAEINQKYEFMLVTLQQLIITSEPSILPFSPFSWSGYSWLFQKFSLFSIQYSNVDSHLFKRWHRESECLPSISSPSTYKPICIYSPLHVFSRQIIPFNPYPHSSLWPLQPSQSPPSLLIPYSRSINTEKILPKWALPNPSLSSLATILFSVWISQKGNIHSESLFSNFTLQLTAI